MRQLEQHREQYAVGGSVPKRFYSERELAAVLGVSVKTIQGWRFRSEGPPWKKLAGTVRYPAEQFDEWVAAAPGGGGR
jgi:predicted DNA-binding transcriptional regulator AlpA